MDNIFIDLSYNTINYILNAADYLNDAVTFQWYEISGSGEVNLGTSATITLNHTIIYTDGDKIRTYKCIINENKVIYFYINYKTFFSRGIEYSLQLIGNPLKLDISYASYTLEYSGTQLLDIGNLTGGYPPFTYKWYDGAELISGEVGLTYLVTHDFNIIEPIADISKSYYCYITSFEEVFPVSTIQFDVLFRAIPLPLSGVQNIFSYTLNVKNSINLKIENIVGGRRPLTITWERTYPGTDYSFYTRSSIAVGANEEVLPITNIREFPINDGIISYKATMVDVFGSTLSFIYEITYKGYYLSEPCFPSGTLIQVYNANDEVQDILIDN